jgi:hypothetical protein
LQLTELKMVGIALEVTTCMVIQERIKGRSSVMGLPPSVNRRFVLQEAKQQCDLLHLSALCSTKWDHPCERTQKNGILFHHSWHEL